MSHDPFLNDLLRGQRGFQRRTNMGRRVAIVVALVLAVGTYWVLSGPSEEEEHAAQILRHDQVFAMATARVHGSIEASRLPLQVVTDEDALSQTDGPPKKEPIKVWIEGQSADFKGSLARNESVFSALQKRKLTNKNIHDVVSATGEKFNFRHSRPKDSWEASVDTKGVVTRFRYQTSVEDIWETRRQHDGTYVCEKVKVPLEARQTIVAGVVSGSLWQSMEQAGLSAPIVGKFIDVFSHEVDFGAQTRPGDRFAIVYEKVFLNGEELRDGRVLAARYLTPEREFNAYWYETLDEDQGYFDGKGKSLQRQFLKSPLSNVRITSVFGKRFHPVLKRWKMHNGVDYGAPTGTPVMAVADGVVAFSGWKGANGNLVSIKHKTGHTTHYAHLSYIPPSIKRGKPVTKKTVIGRVGSTGRSTGPHLHFGMSVGGKYMDPFKVDFVRGRALAGKELERLGDHAVDIYGQLLSRALLQDERNTQVSNVIASDAHSVHGQRGDDEKTAFP